MGDLQSSMESLSERAEFLGVMMKQVTDRVKSLEQSNVTRAKDEQLARSTWERASQPFDFGPELTTQVAEIHTWIKNAKVKGERTRHEKKGENGEKGEFGKEKKDALPASSCQNDFRKELEDLKDFQEFQRFKKWKRIEEGFREPEGRSGLPAMEAIEGSDTLPELS